MSNYASIIPLIGGETIAMEQVWGQRPDYILSYSDFQANDSHLNNYYNHEVPYLLLDEGKRAPHKVDVINTVCPCAGLSSLSTTSGADNEKNDWMVNTSKYVLEELKPKVFWGENAPGLANKKGAPVVAKLRKIARDNGYTLTLYKTKSLLHGLSQIRDRSFYFFWKGDKVPMFNYFRREHTKIEDQIRSSATNEPDAMFDMACNTIKPSEDPIYKYILEGIHGGISHMDFWKSIEGKGINVLSYIQKHPEYDFGTAAKWLRERGYEREADKNERRHAKISAGKEIMKKSTEVGKDYIGAFVGHWPRRLAHPDQDRYLNVRECLDIMKLPKDFELLGGVKNLNHICQNVPVSTAADMAGEIKKYLAGELELFKAPFAIQDNKSPKFIPEEHLSTLEAFV